MYLEIDEGYWRHPKTLDLCSRLEDDQADRFPPRLWQWACRSARDGKLGKVTAYAFEIIVRANAGGKCFEAFIACGFLDRSDDGEVTIHNWMQPGRTGYAIAKMEAKAAENRQRRATTKARYDAERAHCDGEADADGNRTATVPVRYSPRHRPDTDQSSDPPLSSSPPDRARVATGGPIQPDTAHNLVWAIKAAVEKAQPTHGMWAPDTFAQENASRLLVGLGDVQGAMPELERKIGLFAADLQMQPWTVKKFCDQYNGIGHERQTSGQPKRGRWPSL